MVSDAGDSVTWLLSCGANKFQVTLEITAQKAREII